MKLNAKKGKCDRPILAEEEDIQVLLGCGQMLEKPAAPDRSVRNLIIAALLKIRDKNGRLAKLTPNRAQREFSRSCGAKSIVLKARQMGITTWVAARFFVSTITKRGVLTVLVAHDQQSAEEIFKIVHRFWTNLPKRLRTGALRTSRANVRQLVFPLLDSEYRVETAADPEAGRGLTIQNLHGSEVARWPGDATGTLASLRAAVPPRGEVVLESTALGTMGCFYDEWQRAEETGHTKHFYPWWWEELYRRAETEADVLSELSEEERELKERHGLSDGQIVFRREIFANFRGLAKQEYAEDAESCFLRSGECVFDGEAIDRRLAECELENDGGERSVIVWYPAMQDKEYVIGVDSAGGGVDGDYCCAQVIDRKSGLQCAELHGHFTPEELACRVAELGWQYNDALLAVERNGQGGEVLAHLRKGHRCENIYFEDEQAGFNTTRVSRPEIIAALGATLSARAEWFNSPRLLREMRTFIRHKDGKLGAAQGAHDDCVMAMGIALLVRERIAGESGGQKAIWASLSNRAAESA